MHPDFEADIIVRLKRHISTRVDFDRNEIMQRVTPQIIGAARANLMAKKIDAKELAEILEVLNAQTGWGVGYDYESNKITYPDKT